MLAFLGFSVSALSGFWIVLIAVLGLVLLFLGGDWLTRGAGGGATLLKLNPLVVGLTVVSIATSLPEMFTSLFAARESPELALGNILGSNLANLGLILGIAALIRPIAIRLELVSREAPIMIVVTVLFIALCWNGLGRLEGVILLAGLVLYLWINYRQIRLAPESDQHLAAEESLSPGLTVPRCVLLIAVGAVLLAVGADLLVKSSVELAGRFGVSEMLIGLTLVAIGTSLPELATSIVAAMRRQADLCVGNLIGSNVFNILLVGGGVAFLFPIPVDPALFRIEFPAVFLIALVTVPIFRTGYIVSRMEGVGLLFLYVVVIVLAAFRPF